MMASTIDPARILRELNELWISLAREHGGEGRLGVLRACAMSLIVLEDATLEQPPVGEILAALMKDHPSRAIVVRVHSRSGARSLEARVTAQCWMPFGQRQQICCEQVEIDSTAAALGDLPPVIRSLGVPDLPLVVWCRNRNLLWSCDLEPLLEQADKLIVNSTGCADASKFFDWVKRRDRSKRVIADLSWTRLTRWREMIAQVFENSSRRQMLSTITSATVQRHGTHAPVRALYFGAWLANALPPDCQIHLVPFEGAEPCQPESEVAAMELKGPSLQVSITQTDGKGVELRIGDFVKESLFHPPNEYELLREELSIQGRDSVYESVLRTVLAEEGDRAR